MVERFVPGPEVAVEGILSDGDLEIIAVFDKPDPLDGPYFEETLYVSPSRLPPRLLAVVAERTQARRAGARADRGPVHAELRVPGATSRSRTTFRRRRPPRVVLEVAARTIGGRCSKAIVLENGSSLEELVLATAVRHPEAADPRLRQPAGVLMIPIPSSGRLESRRRAWRRPARSPAVTGVEITIPPGRPRARPAGGRPLSRLRLRRRRERRSRSKRPSGPPRRASRSRSSRDDVTPTRLTSRQRSDLEDAFAWPPSGQLALLPAAATLV